MRHRLLCKVIKQCLHPNASIPRVKLWNFYFFATFPMHALNCVHFSTVVCQMAWLGFFPTSLCHGARNRTHVTSVSRIALTRDLLKDALPTELPRRGMKLMLKRMVNLWIGAARDQPVDPLRVQRPSLTGIRTHRRAPDE